MNGVFLAGANGVELYPTMYAINKHFILVYDEPTDYY